MLESYITPLVLSYVDKYVKNLKPSDLQLSFWGGDAVLKNLELRLDVLEKELGYPLEFKSGRVQELTIHIPWTALGSEPVEVQLNNVEFVLKLKDVRVHSWNKPRPTCNHDEAGIGGGNKAPTPAPSPTDQQTPGYLAGLLDRIVSNIVVRVRNVVVKVVEEECDLMVSLNLRSLDLYTVDDSWHRKYVYTDSYPGAYSLFRVCDVSDVTVCLDQVGSSGQVDVFEEPFLARCSFTVRMETKFVEGAKVKHTTHIHCGALHFSATEAQFCLFMHLMDWLLAMYYSSKKLKGRDDQNTAQEDAPTEIPLEPTSQGEAAPVDAEKEAGRRGSNGPVSGQSVGWGAWMWSLLDAEDQDGGRTADAPQRKGSSPHQLAASSAFGIYVETIKVTFRVTQRGRQPTFFVIPNVTSRTSFSVHFNGCMARVEKEPSVQRFLVSVGIMGITSSVQGLCLCTKKTRRSNWGGDFGTGQGCEVKVFTLGREDLQPQALLQGSLFGLPYKQAAGWMDTFSAVSFSYDYYDRGPLHQVEQCAEALRVGAGVVVLGPDVIHRLHHFLSAFLLSLGTRPLLSQGMVVIGDPVAETTFNVTVSHILLCVTSNSHFAALPSVPQLPGNQSSTSSHPQVMDALCLRVGSLTANIIMPMYGGNATEDISQRFHASVELSSTEVDLCTQFNPVIHFVTLVSPLGHDTLARCVSVPHVTLTYHSQAAGGVGAFVPTCLGLALQVVDVTASLQQLSVIFSLASSWRVWPAAAAAAHRIVPPPQAHHLGEAVSLTVKGVELERATSEGFTSYSLVVKGVCAWVLGGGGSGGEDIGKKALVLCGPFESARWVQGAQLDQQGENFIESFLSIPSESQQEKMFPVLQLTVSGFGTSLEPAFLDYIRALPIDLLTVPPDKATEEVLTSMASAAGSVSLTPPTTPPPEVEHVQEHKDWLTVVRMLVIKVKMSPSLIMTTQVTQFQDGAEADTFPALSLQQVPLSLDKQAVPAVVLVLPSVQLGSTHGHILDQPVLKGVLLDTLPWECRASLLCLFTLQDGASQFILEPTSGEVTMAMTGSVHQGVMFQVVVPSLVINLSKSQASWLKAAAESLIHTFSHLHTTSSLEEVEEEEEERPDEQEDITPGTAPPLSVLSSVSPTPSTHTVTTFPAPSESVATSTSSALLCPTSWSSLWFGFTLPKLSVNLHFVSGHTHPTSKLSVDIEGITFSVDAQGRSTITTTTTTTTTQLKVTSAECTYLCSEDNSIWRPLLTSGKVFSSTGSVLPKLCSTVISTCLPSLHMASREGSGCGFVPTFVQVEFKAASNVTHPRASRLGLNIQPFEVVLWLPLVEDVREIVSAILPQFRTEKAKPGLPGPTQWPAVEASVGCVRVIAPDVSYANVIFFDMELLRVTSTPDNPVARHVVNCGAYKRLLRTSGGGGRVCLPGYQLDATSISLWGMKADKLDSAKGFVFATSFSVRSLFAPPLYCKASTVDAEVGVLACGCSVEVNIDTEASLVVGMEQVMCVCNVLSTNFLSKGAPVCVESVAIEMEPAAIEVEPAAIEVEPAAIEVEPVPIEMEPNPLQILLTARALSVVVLSLEPVAALGTSIVPMLQVSLFNTVLALTLNQGGMIGELSCFNAAVNCCSKPSALDLVFLQDSQVMLQALPTCLLQTRKGWVPESDILPPSFLVLQWHASSPQQRSTTSISLAIKRPVKVYLLPSLVKQLLALCIAMVSAVKSLIPSLGDRHSKVQEDMHLQQRRGTNVGSLSEKEKSTTLLTFSTTQVLVEFWHPSDTAVDALPSLQSKGTLDNNAALIRNVEEGVLMAWNQCDFTFSEAEGGHFTISGLLLSQLCEGHVIPLVLPMQWTVSMVHLSPTSNLDLPSMKIDARCDLLNIQLSQRGILLLSNLAHAATEMLSPLQKARSGDVGRVEVTRKSEVVHSTDDLKTSPFTFITSAIDASVAPSPGPHEVVFHLGSAGGEAAGMSWCYGEPRVVTRLKVSPVPFCVTTEGDVPVDLRVECQLQAWDEVSSCYLTMCRFNVTETSESIIDVTPTGGGGSREGGGREDGGDCRLLSYRRWRISLCAFQWTEVEEDEVFINKVDVSDEIKSHVVISSILSPLSLVACVRVDSYFDRSMIDTCVVCLHCKEAELHLLHMGRTGEVSSFHQYTISDTPLTQELMRCGVHQIKADIRLHSNDSACIELKCLCGLEFMDFRDLTWRTAIFPTSVSMEIKPLQIPEHHLAKVPSSYAVSLATDLSTVRVSQGLVHTLTAALEVVRGVSSSRGMVFNHYLICNDTLEELHFGQASTDEDIPLLSRCCVGYSWRTHTAATQLLHTCLVGDGRWRWTKPFSIDIVGTHVVQLYVGRYLANLFVHISNMGGLQKKITFSGAWRLCSELSFDIEVQVTCSELSYCQSLFNGGRLKLCGHGNACSVLAADVQVTGFQFRIDPDSSWSPGPDPIWSPPYPVASSTEGWNKPPLLVEVTTKHFSSLSLWCSTKMVEDPGTKVAWYEVTIAPLVAIHNSFPSDLVVWSSCSPSGEDQTERIVPGMGTITPLVDFQDSKWYHLRFGMRGTKVISDDPPLSVATFLIEHLPVSAQDTSMWPFSDSCDGSQKVGSVAVALSLATGDGGNNKVQAVLTRSSSNCIMVDLKPECLIVNHCPMQVVVTLGGDPLQEHNDTSFQLMAGQAEVLTEKEFSLKMQCRNGQWVASKPIALPVRTEDPGTKGGAMGGGGGERYRLKPKTAVNVVLTWSESGSSTETEMRLVGELSVLFNWHRGMAIVVLTPSTVVMNSCKGALHIWPCELGLEQANEGADACSLGVSPEGSAAIMFWHKMAEGATRAVRVRGPGHSDSWSIPISLSFVRRSFALPVCAGGSGPVHCVLSRHQHNHMTYIVISFDRSPRLLVQNLTSAPLEVVEAGIQGIDGFPQSVLSSSQVVYEPPSLAVTYPVIPERATPVQPSFSLQFRRCGEHHKPPSPWSCPLAVTSGDLEKLVTLPGEEGSCSFLVLTYQHGDTIHLSILPTGGSTSPLQGSISLPDEAAFFLTLDLFQTIICLDDEASDPNILMEVVRVVVDRLHIEYHSTPVEGRTLDVLLSSVQVDNMLEHCSHDFPVVLLPRSEHVRRPSLVEVAPPPLLKLLIHYRPHSHHFVDHLSLSLQPITVQVDDGLIRKIMDIASTYGAPGGISGPHGTPGGISGPHGTPGGISGPHGIPGGISEHAIATGASVPQSVIVEAQRDSAPLVIREFVIQPVSCYLSAKLSVWVYLSCDSTHFHFPQYVLGWMYSNWTELLHLLGAHYMSSLLTHVGSLVGSLDLLGSPGTFVRNVGSGLRDFITLPYEGITRSPSLFVWGVGQGTAAFLYHLSAGALKSLVNFSSSVSQNMERLSLDPDHTSYLEQSRRSHPPSHFISGVAGGVSSFGLSLISAVGGLVEHPLQGAYTAREGSSSLEVARGVLAGVGKGLLGVVTKPVGGAMELVSQTGKGLMMGTGLVESMHWRSLPPGCHTGTMSRAEASNMGSTSKCAQKFFKLKPFEVLLCCPATCTNSVELCTSNGSGACPCTLILTPSAIHLLDHTTDLLLRSFAVGRCTVKEVYPTDPSARSELWIQTQETGVRDEIRGLRNSAQGYLDTPSLLSPSSQPTDPEVLTTGGPGSSPAAVLQLESHHCAQMMGFLCSLLKHHKHPDVVFLMHTHCL